MLLPRQSSEIVGIAIRRAVNECNRNFSLTDDSPGRRQTFVIRISLTGESGSGHLVEKEVEGCDAAVAGDEEISPGVRRRRAGAAR